MHNWLCSAEIHLEGCWQPCALKCIPYHNDKQRQRIEAEMAALQKFSHLPNTLTLLGFKWMSNTVYIVTR